MAVVRKSAAVGARRAAGKESRRRKASREARHSNATPDWGTPDWLVGVARSVLGDFDLDPASSVSHNRRIKAKKIYTEKSDGLAHPWHGRIFVNPPGTDRGKTVKRFWEHLVSEWNEGRVTEAIWIGFSLEQLLSLQKTSASLMPFDFMWCVLRSRVAFIRGTAKQPGHGNFVVYLHSKLENGGADRFRACFSMLGQVIERP